MKSNDQVARLLGLVPYLQRNPGASVTQVAGEFGVTPKQLMSDLKALWMCGLPGGLPGDLIEIDMDAVEADGRIHLTNADYLSRPMRLGADEALAMIAGLEALGEVAAGEARQAVDSALEKLRGLLGEQGVPVSVTIVSGEPAIRAAVQDAITQQLRVRLRYVGAKRESTPVVDPVRVEVVGGYAYLDAWSTEANGWRSFRLDRILAIDPTGVAAADHGEPPRPGSWFDDAPTEMTIRLSRRAAWVVEYYPTSSVIAEGETLLATLPVVDLDWATSFALRLGPEAEVLSPDSVTEAVRAEAREALLAYGEVS